MSANPISGYMNSLGTDYNSLVEAHAMLKIKVSLTMLK